MNSSARKATVVVSVTLEVDCNYGPDWKIGDAHKSLSREGLEKLSVLLGNAKIRYSNLQVESVRFTTEESR